MHLTSSYLVSPCLLARFPIALLLGVIGCGSMPANSPTPSMPSSNSATGSNAATGPILGYAWDQKAAGLRPVLGVPGAAQFGTPIYGGASYNGALACTGAKYVLLTNSSGQASLAPLPQGVPVQIADHLSAKEQIAISPSCSAAVFYAPGFSTATLVLGLPTTPKAQTLDLSQAGLVTTAIVSDSGLVLAGSGATGGTNVTAVSPDGTATQVTTVAGLGGMAFLPSSQNALIGDAGRSTVWLASNLPASISLSRVATAADGVAQPTAIASSSDGRWLIVANQKGAVLRLDLTRRSAPAVVTCSSCTSMKLIPLTGNSSFLLSDLTSGPIWTFDGDSPSPRVVFIPAIKSSSTAGVK